MNKPVSTMTGRDLIIYILENGLLDEPIFKDGKPIGCLTIAEAAEKANVGIETIKVWVKLNWIDCITIGHTTFIPVNFDSQLSQNGGPIV